MKCVDHTVRECGTLLAERWLRGWTIPRLARAFHRTEATVCAALHILIPQAVRAAEISRRRSKAGRIGGPRRGLGPRCPVSGRLLPGVQIPIPIAGAPL